MPTQITSVLAVLPLFTCSKRISRSSSVLIPENGKTLAVRVAWNLGFMLLNRESDATRTSALSGIPTSAHPLALTLDFLWSPLGRCNMSMDIPGGRFNGASTGELSGNDPSTGSVYGAAMA